MCQTALISDRIINIGTRTYRNNLESLGNRHVSPRKLCMLNRDLDNLSELLYEQFPTISAKDYDIFGDQLRQLLDTVNDLYVTCKMIPASCEIKKEIEKLGMNHAALSELYSDIYRYRVKTATDPDLKRLLKDASNILSSI